MGDRYRRYIEMPVLRTVRGPHGGRRGGHRRQVFTKTAGHVSTKMMGTTGDGRGWVMTAGDGRQSMSDKWWCAVTEIINNIPTRKITMLNSLSSAVSVKIRQNRLFRFKLYYSSNTWLSSLAYLEIVMPGNSIDSPASGYTCNQYQTFLMVIARVPFLVHQVGYSPQLLKH